MVVSHETVLGVLEVVRKVVTKYVDKETASKIVDEIVKGLCSVPGNASFRETVERMTDELRNRRAK
jgi:hypothetical protein